jgi:peptide/nickel transport system permease protein
MDTAPIVDPDVPVENPLAQEFRYKMYLFKKSPLAIIGLAIIIFIIIIAIIAPYIAPHDPEEIDLYDRHSPPSEDHPFGTDDLGRDIYSMILHGARVSLRIGLIVVSIALLIGITLGLTAGYFGGWVDEVIMRTTDVFLAFPGLILAMAIVATLVASDPKSDRLMWVMVALAAVAWPGYVRLVRGTVLSVKENTYVESARALGAGHGRIMRRHILPNCLSPVIVTASMNLGTVILAAAGLSFIGLGAEAGTAEWGSMVATGMEYMVKSWWIATFPGLAILITVLGFNLFGDGLRDVLDPKLRR